MSIDDQPTWVQLVALGTAVTGIGLLMGAALTVLVGAGPVMASIIIVTCVATGIVIGTRIGYLMATGDREEST
jgi:hypothetical protein